MQFQGQKSGRMVLIGVWANRNWILGNWIRELKIRSPQKFKIRWVPTIYGNKRFIERFLKIPIPNEGAYFFSYPTIFAFYHNLNSEKFSNNSIVLYPHNEPEMGSLSEQVLILNKAFKVYFFCQRDFDTLVHHGLSKEKAFVAHCAIDVDCFEVKEIPKNENTVILASKYGPRKGLDLLPEVVRNLSDWNFIAMGKGWEHFIKESGLTELKNFKYVEFNKKNRSKYFSRARVFLSLSRLEGGPVPLIESMLMGCVPICTDTGFARDFINDGQNGYIIPTNPTAQYVVEKIKQVVLINESTSKNVAHLTWDRIARFTHTDLFTINLKKKRSDLNVKFR